MLDPRFERSVRRWLWAYPRRWRWARADEVVGTLADIASPGAARLDVRSGLGLVVHGLATRRRMRPPLRVRRRYRWVNGVVPPEDRGWVADKIASPWFQAGPLLGLAIYELTFTMLRAYNGDGAFGEVAWAGSVALALLLVPKTHARRAAATRHLVVRPGDPPTAWDLMPGWVYRDRLSARSVLPAAATALVPVTVLTAALPATERCGDAIALAACVSVGFITAARLALRWRRWALRRPGQPARHVLDAGRRWTVAIWTAALAAALTAVPWTGPFSRHGLVLAPVVLGGALAILPVLVCAAVLTRNAPDDIAVIDVWRLLVGRGPLPVDTLERGVVPASFALQAPDGFGYAPPSTANPRHRLTNRSVRAACGDSRKALGRSGKGGAVRMSGEPNAAPRETAVGLVVVDVMPKPEILDPQGKAVAGALPRLGFAQFTAVRQGKRFELTVEGPVTPNVLAAAREAAVQVLSNPVIEDVVNVADGEA